ncbi:MAG TPA: hypothetical protein VM431_12405 [Phycisphaerae bacterium]|nr:hypothetical protein [Phycisphaerae bacterium]
MAAWKPSGLGPEFTYDLSQLRKVDPALVRWKQVAAVATGDERPKAIAAAGGGVLVASDTGVRLFDAQGKSVSQFSIDVAPYAIATNKAGTIYLAAKDHVEVYDAAGKRAAAWESLGERAYLTGLAAGEDDVFAADAGNCVLMRYDAAGKVVNRIGEEDAARHAPGLIIRSPYLDVALGRQGMLWLVDPGRRQVECYTYDGDFRFAWGKTSMKTDGFCGCCNPTHLAIMADGRFVTSEKGLPRVKVYDPEGHFISVVAAPDDFDEGTVGLDLAVDAAGRILVLDPERRQVRVFAPKTDA